MEIGGVHAFVKSQLPSDPLIKATFSKILVRFVLLHETEHWGREG